MDWIKLVDLEQFAIARGTVLRLPGKWPYEKLVEFMVVDIPSANSAHTIIVSSGHKAGLVLVRLPLEAKIKGSIGVSRQWLVENWNKWVYQECSVDEVLYKRRHLVEQ